MIKKGQIYKGNRNNTQIEISGKKGGKWQAKVLTIRPGVYNGSHSFTERTIKKNFTLCEYP